MWQHGTGTQTGSEIKTTEKTWTLLLCSPKTVWCTIPLFTLLFWLLSITFLASEGWSFNLLTQCRVSFGWRWLITWNIMVWNDESTRMEFPRVSVCCTHGARLVHQWASEFRGTPIITPTSSDPTRSFEGMSDHPSFHTNTFWCSSLLSFHLSFICWWTPEWSQLKMLSVAEEILIHGMEKCLCLTTTKGLDAMPISSLFVQVWHLPVSFLFENRDSCRISSCYVIKLF